MTYLFASESYNRLFSYGFVVTQTVTDPHISFDVRITTSLVLKTSVGLEL